MSQACGIDFGTSNSTVGCWRQQRACLLPLEEGRTTLPSVLFFNNEEQEVAFGRAALADYLAGYEGRLMRALKSLLGTPMMEEHTEVLGKALPFRQVLLQFIAELKRRAEAAADQEFSQVVLGRPVFFVDDNPAADRQAEQTLAEVAHASGFAELAFQYEPIAAAFAYEAQIEAEELVLVADIGGGTSDFSLVRLGPARQRLPDRRADILGYGGIHIGGTDFDKYLSLGTLMPALGMGGKLKSGSDMPSSLYFDLATWHRINMVYAPKVRTQLGDLRREVQDQAGFERLWHLLRQRDGHWLAHQVEAAKIALSQQETVQPDLGRLKPPLPDKRFTRLELAQRIQHLLDGVGKTLEAVLRDAGVRPEAVDTVFLTGGSSAVLALQQRIVQALPGARLVKGDPFGSIGAGLTIDASRRFG